MKLEPSVATGCVDGSTPAIHTVGCMRAHARACKVPLRTVSGYPEVCRHRQSVWIGTTPEVEDNLHVCTCAKTSIR